MTGLYQKLLEKVSAGEAADVFVAEEALGKEEIRQLLEEKRKTAGDAARHLSFKEYALVSVKEKIREVLNEVCGENFTLANPPERKATSRFPYIHR